MLHTFRSFVPEPPETPEMMQHVTKLRRILCWQIRLQWLTLVNGFSLYNVKGSADRISFRLRQPHFSCLYFNFI